MYFFSVILQNIEAVLRWCSVPESFLIKLQADARCFPVNCVKLLTAPLFREHLRWLLSKTGCLTGTLIVKNLSNHLKVY